MSSSDENCTGRSRADKQSDSVPSAPATHPTAQLHIRLLPKEALQLRELARSRGQTLSGAVRYLLRKELRSERS